MWIKKIQTHLDFFKKLPILMLKNVNMDSKEKQIRNSKEITLKDCGDYNAKIGTVCRKTSDSIYIQSKTKLINKDSETEIGSRLKNVKNEFVKTIERTVRDDSSLSNNTVYDIQYSDSGLTYKKMTYFKYELFVRPVTRGDFSSHEKNMELLAKKLNNELDILLAKNGLK